MIRWVFVASMTLMLCIVLYIPSRVSADRLADLLREEHGSVQRRWGPDAADRVLTRMLDLQSVSPTLSEPPAGSTGQGSGALNRAVSTEMERVSMRMFRNAYFRSIDALIALVTYRLSAALEFLPMLWLAATVVVADGFMVRAVRARELVAHSAELFGVSAVGAILLLCGVLVSWFLPLPVDPLWIALALLAMVFCLGRAIANYHVVH